MAHAESVPVTSANSLQRRSHSAADGKLASSSSSLLSLILTPRNLLYCYLNVCEWTKKNPPKNTPPTIEYIINNYKIVMIRYIENIDITFSISIYHIVLSKNIEFFDILRYFLYIAILSIYRDILRQKFIFLLLHYQNNENKRRKTTN